jgi:Transglycosylase SLT domain
MGNVITPYSGVPEVAPQATPQPYQNISVNADQFGANIGGALEKAGATVEQFADRQQNFTNELYANDTATQGMKALNGAWDEYGNNRGRAAHDNLPDFQNKVEQIYKDTIATAPNDSAKAMLSKSMRSMADRYLMNGQSHATTQLNQWRDQSTKDHSTELANQAALAVNDPDAMRGFIEAGAHDWKTYAEEHSLDPESTDSLVRKYKGSAYHSIIAERVATGDLQSAQRIFADHAEEMDAGSRVTVERLMNPAVKTARLNAVIDHLLGGEAGNPDAGGDPQSGATRPNVTGLSTKVSGAIDDAAQRHGVDPEIMRAFARIESGGKETAQTGSYKGLFQLSDKEFGKYATGGNIFDAATNADAAAAKIATESKSFEAKYGHKPSAFDLYMVHQQGEGGYANHMAHPDRPAWQNMADTAEGRQKGAGWAKQAIWGNIPTQMRGMFGNVDDVTSAQFMDVWRERVDHFSGQPATAAGMPDKNATFAKAAELTKGDPQLQHQVFTELGRRYHDFQTANATEIQQIKLGMPQLIEAAKTGAYDGDMPIPEERIRALLPGADGEKMIREFKFAQFEGGLMKEAQFATPEAIGDMERDVFEGTGTLSMRMQAHRGAATTGPGMSGADAEADSVDFAKERKALAGRFEAFKQQRQKLLTGPDADPAAYAGLNPEVKAARDTYAQAYQDAQGKPGNAPEAVKAQAAWQDYASRSTALQAALGVPEGDRHLLPRGQAIDLVGSLTKPNADAKSIMDGMEHHYGSTWPAVLKDMSTIGNMPPAYQSLQVLDPQNASQLSQFLQTNVHPKAGPEGKVVGPDKGIAETMDQALTPKTAKTIRDSIVGDPSVQKMLQAYDAAGGSLDFNSKLLQSMHFLAYAKTLTGMDAATASSETIKAFTKNTEFLDGHGGAMVPAERIDDTRANIRAKMETLTPETLATPEVYKRLGIRTPFPDIGEGGVVGAPHVSDWLNRLKSNPRWINNTDHSGVWLTDGGVTGGTGRVVRDKDGKPVEVKFADIPAPRPLWKDFETAQPKPEDMR